MSEMKQVYVVEGSTGEYSDHCEWPVCAYTNEDEAKEHVVAADTWAREQRVSVGTAKIVPPDWEEREALQNPYDPNMQIDYYTGVRYCYYAVDVYPSREAFTRRSSR